MPASPRLQAPAAQRGIATLLIILMVGLAVSVTVAATLYSLRGAQQRQLTEHSVTAAQAAAWRGVEVLRLYLVGLDGATYANWAAGGLSLPAAVSGLSELGVPDGNAVVTALSGTASAYQVTARVTGTSGSGSAVTTATVEVVYSVAAGSAGAGSNTVCGAMPTAPMVFNGDLNISGGSLGVVNATDYENIAVSGDINLSSASQATISGCAKGDVSLSGGGISSGGHVYSEGTISINQMSNPTNTTLWGRNVTIGSGVSGGSYAAVKAGAYAVTVYQGEIAIGTAEIGGTLIPSTVSGGIPWVAGVVLPFNSGKVVVTLASGDKFLLDMSTLVIDAATGVVSGVSSAELLSGSSGDTLPEQLTFRAGSIAGGAVNLSTLTIVQLWGHAVSITGWSGKYTTVLVNGNFNIVTGTIGTLNGGGDMQATSGGCAAGNYYSFPTITGTGSIAGVLKCGSGAVVPASAITHLQTAQEGTSPGLPGIPYCDTRVNTVDTGSYKASANYVFEVLNGVPTLTIQNVKTAAGTSIDGVYNLLTEDLRRIQAATGTPFLTCNWQSPDNANAHCFRDVTSVSGWNAVGVTHFPRGIAWFDGPVKIDGTSLSDSDGNRDLLDGIIAKGYVTLTSSGHGQLVAPNFSTVAKICDGAFWPSNLCDKSGGASKFATWTDAAGEMVSGLPIGNVAVMTESGAELSGWTIYGHVILGGALSTSANKAVINGSLTVGANSQSGSTTAITQGGAQVIVPNQGSGTNYLPGTCSTTPSVPGGSTQASVLWSHYL